MHGGQSFQLNVLTPSRLSVTGRQNLAIPSARPEFYRPDSATPRVTARDYRSRSMSHLQTPLQPPTPFALGYLEAAAVRRQPLCGSSEGWGPISRDRYDFTPCFLDVWIAVVAAVGILDNDAQRAVLSGFRYVT